MRDWWKRQFTGAIPDGQRCGHPGCDRDASAVIVYRVYRDGVLAWVVSMLHPSRAYACHEHQLWLYHCVKQDVRRLS